MVRRRMPLGYTANPGAPEREGGFKVSILRILSNKDELLYGVGVSKLGMPYEVMRRISDTVDRTRNSALWKAHKKAGEELVAQFPEARGVIDPVRGFGSLTREHIPGWDELFEQGAKLVAEKAAKLEQPSNEPYVQYMDSIDLQRFPIFFKIATDPKVVAILSAYHGIAPQLRNISILGTKPVEGVFSSMQWHLDRMDTGYTGLWINLIETDSQCGPFTFIPADTSRRICDATDQDRRHFLGDTRVADGDIAKFGGTPEIRELVGKPGENSYFVDTSRCLHMGGRCRAGMRAALHIRYSLPHKIGSTYRERFKHCDLSTPMAKLLLPEH